MVTYLGRGMYHVLDREWAHRGTFHTDAAPKSTTCQATAQRSKKRENLNFVIPIQPATAVPSPPSSAKDGSCECEHGAATFPGNRNGRKDLRQFLPRVSFSGRILFSAVKSVWCQPMHGRQTLQRVTTLCGNLQECMPSPLCVRTWY